VRSALSSSGPGQILADQKKIQETLKAHDEAILELRGLGGRVSELADLVTELLIVAATREDPEFQRVVKKYLKGV
jgi:hypothetical protein